MLRSLSKSVSSVRSLGRFVSSHPLTRDAQAAAWARFAAWQVRSRLNDEVLVPWVGGQYLVIRRGMTGATGNVYFGLHEFMSMMLTLHFLREGDLFIDAGANVGAETWAIEPAPEVLEHLRRNIEVNGLGVSATIHPVALGPVDGEIHFTMGLDALNRVASPQDENVRTVRQRSLDTLLGGRRPAMIKFDVEEYEEQVLRGAENVIGDPTLKVIAQEGTTPWMLDLLTKRGFQRAYYDPFTRKLQRSPNSLALSGGKWTRSNEFFVRDWEFVEARLATAKPITVLGKAI